MLKALKPEFTEYSKRVIKNAQALANELIKMDYQVISGGTDNHSMLIDLHNKDVTGKEAEIALDASGITCNKNAVPYDDRPPLVTSGIRLGSAAMTTRGLNEDDMRTIASFIDKVITNHSDDNIKNSVKNEVKEFLSPFPLFKW